MIARSTFILSLSLVLLGCDSTERELRDMGFLEHRSLCNYDSVEDLQDAEGIIEPGWGRHGHSVRLRQEGTYPENWKTVANISFSESALAHPNRSVAVLKKSRLLVCVQVTGKLIRCKRDFPELFTYKIEYISTSDDLSKDCFGQPTKYASQSSAERVADLAGAN
ncbi:MAG: hypothetical protein AAF205_08125 [Pseudomonadota bacterium]